MELKKNFRKNTSADFRSNFINQSLSEQPSSFVSTHSINADTGTTGNFISLPDAAVLLDVKPVVNGISVALPNGQIIISTHTATLNLPTLPLAARAAHIFPSLQGSLLSIGMLTDAGLTAIYTSDAVTIQDAMGITVLSGYRSPSTRLWMIDLPSSTTVSHTEESSYYASAVIHHENDSQLVHFYHATLSAPALSTFIEASRRGYLDCFPQLTVQKIRRYKPHVVVTSLGHLDQTHKNYRSTKHPIRPLTAVAPATAAPIAIETDIFPSVESTHTNVVYTRIERTHKNCMDSSGRFPVQSRAGNEYISPCTTMIVITATLKL